MIKLPSSITPRNLIWYAIAAIPLASKVGYMLRMWAEPSVDRYDLIFWIGAAAFLVINCKTLWEKPKETLSGRIGGSLLLLAAAAAIGFSFLKSVNSAGILGGIMLLAGFWLFRRGELAFSLVLPAFVMMVFGIPSTTQWIGTFSGFHQEMAGFFIKLGLTALMLVLWYLRKWLSLQTSCFICAAVLTTLICLSTGSIAARGEPLFLDSDFTGGKTWIANDLRPTAVQSRYFEGSDSVIIRIYYPLSGEQAAAVGLLGIMPGENIHAIHPAAFCARNDGDTPLSVRQRTMTIKGKIYPVEELNIRTKAGKDILMWNWYTGPDFSTADFKTFRILWKQKEKWAHYQLKTYFGTTPDNNLEAAQKRLTTFIESAQKHERLPSSAQSGREISASGQNR